MTYVSSACSRRKNISEMVKEFTQHGIDHIELTGGFEWREDWDKVLSKLKEEYNVEFLCHNYFPPPKEGFVINLASMDDNIYEQSLRQIRKSLNLTRNINARKFGFHAGFYFDFHLDEIGRRVTHRRISNKQEARERFIGALNQLNREYDQIEIYLENNVVSEENFRVFHGENPFMLTTFEEFIELRKEVNFQMLTDVGHLKVTSQTLGKDFGVELRDFMSNSDYIHLSDNDGISDGNRAVEKDSILWSELSQHDIGSKTVTVEVYEDLQLVLNTVELLGQ